MIFPDTDIVSNDFTLKLEGANESQRPFGG